MKLPARPSLIEVVSPSTVRAAGVTLAAVAAGLVASGVVFAVYGIDPVEAYAALLRETLGDGRGFAEVVRKSLPLLLIAAGLVFAFRARFVNIGAEGQLLAGAAAASGVALFGDIPPPYTIGAMFLAGFVAGALWAALPALLKVKLGVNEVITTLMLNFVAIYGIEWLINGPWKGRTVMGFAYSDPFPTWARLPVIAGTRIHWPTLALGILAAVLLHVVLSHTRLGFEVRVLGNNPEAAEYAGINALRVTLWAALIAGGLAGLAGVGEVAGTHFRLRSPAQISPGFGYTAILAAQLARGQPLASIVSALFLGLIFAAGDVARVLLRMPTQLPEMISGMILLAVVSAEFFIRHRLRRAPAQGAAKPAGAAAGKAVATTVDEEAT